MSLKTWMDGDEPFKDIPPLNEEVIDEPAQLGKQVDTKELEGLFQAPEGELNMYFGQIGSGKTYMATADIHDDLRNGHVVYATWPIKVADYDGRESTLILILNTLLGRKRFYRLPCAENFHFIDVEKGEVDGLPMFEPNNNKEYIAFLNTLNHCKLYIDEAWRVIDSYASTRDFGVEVRSLILVTRHKFRTVNLIAQRPTSIQVTARANVNRFYRATKLISFMGWIRFMREEFQEMTGETVDVDQPPISVKTYWGNKKIFDSYNSYFYGELDPVHALNFQAFDLSLKEKIIAYKLKIMKMWKVIHRLSTGLSTGLSTFFNLTKR